MADQRDRVGVECAATLGFADLVATWMPFALALNTVNRSMGKDDLYPFVLSERVVDKFGFVHGVVWLRGFVTVIPASLGRWVRLTIGEGS